MDEGLYEFAVLEGDLRQRYIAQMLREQGYSVIDYVSAIDDKTCGKEIAERAESLEEAIGKARVIIGAISLKNQKTIEALKAALTPEHVLYAGCIPLTLRAFGKEQGITMYDFMENEELAIFNAIATAEGTIAEAIQNSHENLQGADCLIFGFGKCGTVLAKKLASLETHITICARDKRARAVAKAYGYQAVTFEELPAIIRKFDNIFNTIPELILNRDLLAMVKEEALIIDIASAPGGVDFEAAKERNLNAHLCLGLPGKYSPKASAEALTEIIVRERAYEIKG